MAKRSYRPVLLVLALALVGLSLDQVTKYQVFAWLTDRPPVGCRPGWKYEYEDGISFVVPAPGATVTIPVSSPTTAFQEKQAVTIYDPTTGKTISATVISKTPRELTVVVEGIVPGTSTDDKVSSKAMVAPSNMSLGLNGLPLGKDAQTNPNTYVLFRTVPDAQVKGFSLVAADFVNQGALFGTKLGLPPEHSNTFFAAVSLLAAIGILAWSFFPSVGRDRVLCISLGLILAGTLGNFYDRVVFHGVRDFLHWNYFYDWPVFNVADCCLVCGAGLMLVQAFFLRPAQDAKAPVADAAAGTAEQDKPAVLPTAPGTGVKAG